MMYYILVLQDYTNFITPQNLHYEMFTMRWKWSACLSDIAYVESLR